jgi:hypothetical protein
MTSRFEKRLRATVNLLGVIVAVVVLAMGVRWLLYREIDIEGSGAQERISTLVDIPSDLIGESTAHFRSIGRLMRSGPLYLCFDGEGGALSALQERWQLPAPSARPIVARASAPEWWPRGDSTLDCYEGSLMTVWVRKTDQVCFVFRSGG